MAAGIPGITSHYPNSHVSTIKSALWVDVLNLLGKEGERILLDLVLDCGIFIAVEHGRGNFYQLSGNTAIFEILLPITWAYRIQG